MTFVTLFDISTSVVLRSHSADDKQGGGGASVYEQDIAVKQRPNRGQLMRATVEVTEGGHLWSSTLCPKSDCEAEQKCQLKTNPPV